VLPIRKKALLLFALLIFPLASFANGGGPLLLFISGSAFLVGQIWILGSETFVYCKSTDLDVWSAFQQVFVVNLASTIVVGIGLPFILAAITAAGMFLPEPLSDYASLLGTWAYEGIPYPNLLAPYTLVWLLITFWLTVLYERWHLSKIWAKSSYTPSIAISVLMFRAHIVSYTGLVLIILYMWGELFRGLLGM
jgi:hypothetical protein